MRFGYGWSNGRRSQVMGSALIALSAVVSAPGHAQTSAGPAAADAAAPAVATDRTIQDIIVTAQRRDERLQSVPVSISAFTGKTLSAIGVTDTQALQTVTPGLLMNKALDSSAPFLRGVGSPDVTPSNEAAVATYLDGFYLISTSSGVFSLSNVDRVEVLKGPQGTLFGRNTTGGLIQIVTRVPTEKTTANVEVGYANYNTVSGRGYLAGGLGGGFTADIAIAGSDQHDGWGVNRANGAVVNRSAEVTARGKLRWSDGDTDVTAALLYEWRRGDIGAAYQTARGATRAIGGTVFADSGPYNVLSDQTPRADVDTVVPTLSVTHDFGKFSLVSLTSYQWVRSHVGIDTDGSALRFANADLRSSSSGWTQELQLVSTPGSPIKWIAGLYGLTRNGVYDPATIGVPPGFVVIHSNQQTTSVSGFGQVTVPLGDATNLTGGLRYSHDRAKAYSAETFNGFSFGPVSNAERTYNKLSYRISVDHTFGTGILGYASYNRGFKAGLFGLITYPVASGETQPEKIDAFELGLKTDLLDNTLRINLATYYYDYSNIQTFFFLNGVPEVINAQKAHIYGAEADVTYRPTANLTLHGGLSVMPEAKYVNFINAPQTTPNPAGGNFLLLAQAAGKRMIRTPRVSADLIATYAIPFDGGKVEVNGVASYTGRFFWSIDNRLAEPAQTVFNASVNLALDSGVSASIWAKNISNRYIYAYALVGQEGDFGIPAPPRTFGVTVGYKF